MRSRLVLACALLGVAMVVAAHAAESGPGALPMAQGPFKPEFDSLKQYQYPDWFRDAKLGMWAHWGPQAVPMAGDWYAKHMYVQGHRQYQHHLENYGHPSKSGYKDIIALWKAEKWDPDRLIQMYKKAGARYFVSMGSHHDNFYLWDSKLHKWNAVNMGPRRDVVGEWQKAAKKYGLRFGVSEHLGASFTWFQDSHKSDKQGPLAGVPYDGADPRYQDLYHFPAEPGDTQWYSNNPRWQRQWYERIRELVDNYQPDLLYTDGGVPFNNEVGRSMIAHLYNASAGRNGGVPQVVYTCKQSSNGMWVEDLERGVMPGIRPYPWQTDTSIGDWYYNKNWKYRDADWVINMLVDIVSKNGNLLINVVQRPDGSLDPEAEKILQEMAEWIAVHGEGIYGSRPWLVHGEGRVRARGGHFNEDYKYTSEDVRFTTQGKNTLYAFFFGWPSNGEIAIRSLSKFPGVTAKISGIAMLGGGEISWRHEADGLYVRLPGKRRMEHASALKITVDDVRAFKPELAAPMIKPIGPDSAGNYVLLPDDADLAGNLHTEAQGGQPNIGFWDNPSDAASWKLAVPTAGTYRVVAQCATTHPESLLTIQVAGRTVEGRITATGAWDRFREFNLGQVELPRGEQVIRLKPKDSQSWKAINLRSVKLVPAKP